MNEFWPSNRSLSEVLLGFAAASFVLPLLACSSSSTAVAPIITADNASAGRSALEVTVVGFRSEAGSALVGLYRSADGFPDDGAKADERRDVAIQKGVAQVRFDSLSAGVVAIGVLHDEDGNKTMKTGLFGRPKEGYGVSRDAAARFGPPSFEDAAIELRATTKTSIQITIRY